MPPQAGDDRHRDPRQAGDERHRVPPVFADPARGRRAVLSLIGLLAAASAIGVGMILARVWYSENLDYGFLTWNLFLAWIPLVFATLATTMAATRRRWVYLPIAIAALAWLLFFPNAPYIVTDFQHIESIEGGAPTWYDVMVVFWFAWTGLLLGVVSLYLMQRVVTVAFGARLGWWFVLAAIALASLGIYIGRFLGWNSWDVFSDPALLADPVRERLRDPGGDARMIAFTLLYALFFLFVYGSLHLFARLVRDAEGPPAPARREGEMRDRVGS